MTQDEAYKAWWHNEGSGIIPLPNEDMEEFAHRMTQIAWSNGAFKERDYKEPKPWVGFTQTEIAEFVKVLERGNYLVAINKIEQALKQKNT